MSSGDETYLEAFMECLSTLPHEVRRNMDLMRDLDKCFCTSLDELRQSHRDYVFAAEEKLLQLEVVPMPPDDGDVEREETLDAPQHSATNVDDVQQQQTVGSNQDLADAAGELYDKDGEVNHALETKIPNLTIGNKRPRMVESSVLPKLGVRVLENDEHTRSTADIIIPTRQELHDFVYQPVKYARILELRKDCFQLADEKIAIAQQTHEWIDSRIQRLDRDIEEMEKLLQASGEFTSGVSAKPNELAACQVTPGSEWILAKVIHYDPTTSMYKLSDEDVESNKIFHLPDTQVVVLRGMDRLSKGDTVFAVYPDTTSFYQAAVVQLPRKSGPNGHFAMLNFVDDSDEFGVTHDKAVPLKHIMPPPMGVALQ